MTAVHQLLPVYSVGDAIGGAVLRIQAMLRHLGFLSEIYAELWDERLAGTRPAQRLLDDAGGDDAVLRSRRGIVYHNITPPAYFRTVNPHVTAQLEQGQDDLIRLAPIADLVIGVSAFNLEDARRFVARRCAVVPPPVHLERLRPRPSRPAAPPSILFVGRIAPNKRVEELLRMFAALRATAMPDARLVIAGNAEDNEVYLAGLQDFAEQLGVAGAVDLSGRRRDDAEIGGLYASAAVYACASEHEGFCVPLLEAMAFEVPIVAFAAGAVPDTLDAAGILLGNRDPLVWAAAVDRLVRDGALRRRLIAAGRRRLADFSEAAVEQRLAAALRTAAIVPPG